jgi:hypothetical protein
MSTNLEWEILLNMKRQLGFALGALLAINAPAQLLVEHFDYANGNLGASGSGDVTWAGGDSPAAALAVNASATLTHPGLFGTSGRGVIYSGGTFKKKAAPFTAQSGNGTTVYVSFLLNVQTAPGPVKALVYLQNGNSASSSPPLGIFLTASGQVGLAKSASSPAVTSAALGAGTHLIVARYTFQAGNDQVDLWANPTSLGPNAIPAATLTTGASSSSDAAALSYVFLNHAAAQTVWLDELRVGNSWAQVTPTDGSTPPPVGAPRITQVFRSGNNLVLSGTNGPAHGPYDVLSATTLALAVPLWPSVGTNVFDAAGNFTSTNPIPLGEPQRFYAIRSGTNTSAPVPDAPEITDQPENLTLTEGQDAGFAVAVTGTAPLLYQWYFGSAPILNGTNATYATNGVSLIHAGGYSVVVNNAGGSATSVVATLTVTIPPPTPPVLTAPPQSIAVSEGASAGFSVGVSGSAPLSYQWFFNTNTPIASGTNATYVIASVTPNDAGVYSVSVTNAIGATNSGFATLTILPPATNTGPFQILQAEDAAFTGKTDNSHSGYTGTGFVDTDNATGAYVEWEFGRQNAGTETVVFRYAHGKTDNRTASLSVNGVVVNGALAFPPTGAFTSWQTVTSTIPINVGRNLLRLTALNSAGLANLDRADVTGDPQFKLTTLANGRGSVSLAPSNAFGWFNPGTLVTLTATPFTNGTFTGWSGALTGTNNPQALTLTSNTSVTASFQSLQAFTLYVATNGSDANPGTMDAPLLTLHAAVASAFAGDVIYLRGGTHFYTSTVNITGHNSSNNPVLITSYPGEAAELNWSNWTPASETIRGAARGMKVTGSYWHLKGFTISYALDNGIKCEGHHNTFEQIVFHHNGDSGIQIGLNKEDYTTNPEPDTRAAHNLVLNCDSYRNADPATSYENADGFACKLYAGRGNKFVGCRAWENCDDGWDLYQTEYEIVLERCWAWHNGDPSLWGFSSFNGDGNSFKLGGDNTYCPVTLIQCVALDAQWGTAAGFAFNNNTAPITLLNCSALNCGRPYKFGQNGNVFKNCLDWNSTRPAPVDITGTSTQVNNSWNLPVSVTVADFVSVLAADAVAPRQPDGSLPDNGFARLVNGSDLIDKGVDVGLPFTGGAPDLGAFERP